ncbi:hypothetical protein AAVH_43744, partial [Aphelenchoides avenae]
MQRQKLSSNELLDVLEAVSRWDLDKTQLALKCFEGLKDRLTQKRVFASVVIMSRGRKWPPYLPDDDCRVVITWQKDADRRGELECTNAGSVQQAVEYAMRKTSGDAHVESVVLLASFGHWLRPSLTREDAVASDFKILFAWLQAISVDYLYLHLDDFAAEHYKQLKSRPRKRMLGTGEWISKRCREIDEEE